MKIVYIAHPIGGNVEANLKSIREIAREINATFDDIVPLIPYYVDVLVQTDHIPELRARGIKNGIAIIQRKGAIDEMWVYGKIISVGVKNEIIEALKMNIPVIAKNSLLENDLKEILHCFKTYGSEK